MSARRALQRVLLRPAIALLRQVVADTDGDVRAAHDVLEAAASQVGGFDLDGYRETLGIEARLDPSPAVGWAGKLLDLVAAGPVPTRLALATLAQPEVTDLRRRVTGAYYTDFRLAQYLARRTGELAATALTPASTIVDPAAGTGVLLVALAERIGRTDQGALRDLVAHGLSAVDLDPACHRGTVGALASLTADLDAIRSMAARIRTADSLVADAELWHRLGDSGRFDAVVGNPPWERLRVTRHETLLAAGTHRHYGADYQPDLPADGAGDGAGDGAAGGAEADRIRRYVDHLASRFRLLDNREIDLCHAFLALGWSLVRSGGSLGMLLPAGLIRGQGTALLRKHLLTNATEIDITVLHNRSRFFDIDLRFKFLAVCAQVSECPVPAATLKLRHGAGTDRKIFGRAPVRIRFDDLAAARRDLTVPEVTGEREWRIFRHMAVRGHRPDDPGSCWAMRLVREIDMTRARPLFRREESATDIPVVEGRMVHQYRSRAKAYVSGTGRAAIWRPLPLGQADAARAQFFVDPARLPAAARERIPRSRVGFCDIVGQTNERTLQAALVAPGWVCGNKVPTIDFLGPDGGARTARELLFLAAANSFVVDWFVRRVVTTSLNFFILLSLPLPPLDPDDAAGRRLVGLAERLVSAETAPDTRPRRVVLSEVARYRAEVDMLICEAYGIDVADLAVILADFPLIDRHQPPLPGEATSTVTLDLLTGLCGNALGRERYLAATGQGAIAYLPEEFARREARRC